MSLLSRLSAWWNTPVRFAESDEDERSRLGMSWREWYREVERPRQMRREGCATIEEHDRLLDRWRAEAHERYERESRAREQRRRELWPKDKPYRSD